MTATRPNKRQQILDAAARCFYHRGITATGVDAIAAEAGVSKRTLYNHFPTKDDLVLAYVEWIELRWQATLDRWLAAVDDPSERVLAYFDAYFDTHDDEEFRGCSLINAAAEIADADSPVLALVQQRKRSVHEELTALVADAGVTEPAATANTLVLLLEGAIANYGVHRDRHGAVIAKDAARRLLRAGR